VADADTAHTQPDLFCRRGAKRCVHISNNSRFQHGEENAWVSVEKHLTGKVVDLGGKQDPNVHLVLADTARVCALAPQSSSSLRRRKISYTKK